MLPCAFLFNTMVHPCCMVFVFPCDFPTKMFIFILFFYFIYSFIYMINFVVFLGSVGLLFSDLFILVYLCDPSILRGCSLPLWFIYLFVCLFILIDFELNSCLRVFSFALCSPCLFIWSFINVLIDCLVEFSFIIYLFI